MGINKQFRGKTARMDGQFSWEEWKEKPKESNMVKDFNKKIQEREYPVTLEMISLIRRHVLKNIDGSSRK